MKKVIFSSIFIFLFTIPISANWEKTNPINPPCIEKYAMIDSNIITLGCDGIHLSSNYGNSWDPDTSKKVYHGCSKRGGLLAVNNLFFKYSTSLTNYIYIMDYFVVSSDYGKTWKLSYEYINFDWDPKSQFPPEIIMAVKDTVVYAAIEGYLMKSYNYGKDWEKLHDSPYALSITATHNGIYIINYNEVLFSSDEGRSWTKNEFLNDNRIKKLYEFDNYQYAIDNNDIFYISSDSGQNWNKLTDEFYLKSVDSVQKMGDCLILTTKSMKGVFKSSDNGITWTQAKLTEDKTIIPSKDDFFLNYLGTIFCSVDKGDTWEPIFQGYCKTNIPKIISSGNNVYGLTASGVYLSTDFGKKWYFRNDSLGSYTALSAITIGDKVYIGMGWGGGIFLSENVGKCWKSLIHGTSHVHALFVNDSCIFGGLWGSGLIVSFDKGVTWLGINCPKNSRDVYSVFVSNDRIIIGSAGSECGIYSSDDNGDNWQKNLTLIKDDIIHNIISLGNSLFACSNKSGIYTSSDNGLSWESRNNGLADSMVNSIISKDNTLFAAANSGVYYSSDFGLNWIQMNDGLGKYPSSLTIAGSYLFASADDMNVESGYLSEVYRSNLSDYGFNTVQELTDYTCSLNISPNLATDFLEISYSPSNNHRVNPMVDYQDIGIYNVFGTKIPPRLTSSATPQEGNFRLDVSSLAPGVYFVKVGERVGKFMKI